MAKAPPQHAIAANSSKPNGSCLTKAPVIMANIGTATVDNPERLAGTLWTMENQVTLPKAIGIRVM